jgi:hypothetical protein
MGSIYSIRRGATPMGISVFARSFEIRRLGKFTAAFENEIVAAILRPHQFHHNCSQAALVFIGCRWRQEPLPNQMLRFLGQAAAFCMSPLFYLAPKLRINVSDEKI